MQMILGHNQTSSSWRQVLGKLNLSAKDGTWQWNEQLRTLEELFFQGFGGKRVCPGHHFSPGAVFVQVKQCTN